MPVWREGPADPSRSFALMRADAAAGGPLRRGSTKEGATGRLSQARSVDRANTAANSAKRPPGRLPARYVG